MNPIRKTVIGAALVGSTLVGGALGASFLGGAANAQTTSTTAAGSTVTAPLTATAPPAHDPSRGGHQGNGITEALLTGDAATQATAAAKAAVPGGTIERVENDAEGAAYEAHMVKADGTHVTVKMDSSYKVTSIESGR
jgi:ABC-type transport system substrate-binding protein